MSRKRIATVLVMILIITAISSAFAYTQKNATLYYNGISIKLDGDYLTPRDVTGAVVNPFIIDGTTYLPIRAVASALGLNVAWEQETQTIRLTSGAPAVRTAGEPNTMPASTASAVLKYPGIRIVLDGNTLTPKDVNGSVVDPFVIDGTTYLPIRAVSSALGLGVDWDAASRTVLLTSGSGQTAAPATTTAAPATTIAPATTAPA